MKLVTASYIVPSGLMLRKRTSADTDQTDNLHSASVDRIKL
jgi:hypothetical protein